MLLHCIWQLSNGLESTVFAAETEWGGDQWSCCLKCYDQVSVMYLGSIMLTSLLKQSGVGSSTTSVSSVVTKAVYFFH